MRILPQQGSEPFGVNLFLVPLGNLTFQFHRLIFQLHLFLVILPHEPLVLAFRQSARYLAFIQILNEGVQFSDSPLYGCKRFAILFILLLLADFPFALNQLYEIFLVPQGQSRHFLNRSQDDFLKSGGLTVVLACIISLFVCLQSHYASPSFCGSLNKESAKNCRFILSRIGSFSWQETFTT